MLVAEHSLSRSVHAQAKPAAKADYTLRIESCNLEIGPNISVKTLAYNGKVPGPLIRLREGRDDG
jgi:FtsP/CotA-like multicopper oxidase with cupredoxin domain